MSEVAVRTKKIGLLRPYIAKAKAAMKKAMMRAIRRVEEWIRGPASVVPVYDPAYYEYPRPEGRTEQLRRSGRAVQVGEWILEISWKTPYAPYLIEKGVRGTARARTPGTKLVWPPDVVKIAQYIFFEEVLNALKEEGLGLLSVSY